MDAQFFVKIEQPDITKMFKKLDFQIASDIEELNRMAVAIGGALAYDRD